MRKMAAGVMLTAWAACGCPAFARTGSPPAHLATVFGALPQVSGVALSRSGRMLAWIQRQGLQSSVVVYDYAAHRVQRVFHVDPRMRPRSLDWDGADMLLVTVNMTVQPGFGENSPYFTLSRTLALDIATGQTKLLLMSGNGREYVTGAQLLLDNAPLPYSVIMFTYQWSGDSYRSRTGTLIHGGWRDSGWEGDLFAVDPYSGADKIIGYGTPLTTGWVVNRDGMPVARAEYHPRHHRFVLQARHGSQWVPIYQRADGVQPALLAVTRHHDALRAIMPARDGLENLWAVPLDGAPPKELLPRLKHSVLSAVVSPSGRVLGVALGGGPGFHWLNAAARIRYESVARAFPGRSVQVYDPSRNGMEVLAKVRGPAHPPAYYLTDFVAHSAMVIGQAYPQLAKIRLASARAVDYRSGDGHEVHAMVFLPPGGARDLPLVILAPGGPEIGGPQRFDWLAQYLAMSGYAVLRPDLSWLGIGGPNREAGTLHQWDGVSQRYALDGLRLVVKEGLADPRRVCLLGVGYGGYAALAGAAFSPQAYACAVSINGISDLSAFIRYEDNLFGGLGLPSAAARYWRAAVGSPTDPKVIAESPANAAQKMRAAVLLLHSVDDTAVPFSQSQEMANALMALGKPVTLIRLPGVDQSLDRSATRIAVLRAITPFLRRYLH